MRNIELIIEYDGSRYEGWSKSASKDKDATIQGKIEEVLSKMEETPVELIGAIRTESGVHAYRQVANFHTESTKKTYEIKQYLNRYLPRDIAVLEALEVNDRFHAAFNAKSFTFEYRITIGEVPSVFDRKYNYYCFKKPDVVKMKEAAAYMTGKHDFAAFSENKRMKKSTVRNIEKIDIYADGKEINITVKGDDFWPYMVRIMVGTILAAGLSDIEPSDVKKIIESKDRNETSAALDAKGLFLSDVSYV